MEVPDFWLLAKPPTPSRQIDLIHRQFLAVEPPSYCPLEVAAACQKVVGASTPMKGRHTTDSEERLEYDLGT